MASRCLLLDMFRCLYNRRLLLSTNQARLGPQHHARHPSSQVGNSDRSVRTFEDVLYQESLPAVASGIHARDTAAQAVHFQRAFFPLPDSRRLESVTLRNVLLGVTLENRSNLFRNGFWQSVHAVELFPQSFLYGLLHFGRGLLGKDIFICHEDDVMNIRFGDFPNDVICKLLGALLILVFQVVLIFQFSPSMCLNEDAVAYATPDDSTVDVHQ